MANSNFVVKNGLTVGALEIDAATGNLTTSGTISGNLSTTSIAKNDTSIALNDTGTGSDIAVTVDGVNLFNITASGIIPTVASNGVTGFDLGSASYPWRDVFVSSGSLYVNGQKVLQEDSGNIVVSADANQNLVFQTTGSGSLELDPTGSGVIVAKGTFQIEDGSNITNSAGNKVAVAVGISTDAIEAKTSNGNLTLSGNGSGLVAINGGMTISGNLTVSGTTTTVNSETISLADNIIDLNSNFTTGTPSENAGIRIMRGDEAAVQLRWNEANDKWELTTDGSSYANVATEAYVSSAVAAKDNTDEITEGSTNLYFTTARARASLSAGTGMTYSSSTGEIATTITQYTDALARAAISVTGSGSYNSTTGVITVTGGVTSVEGKTGAVTFTHNHSSVYVVTSANATSNASGSLALTAATLGFDMTGAITYQVFLNRQLLRPTEVSVNTTNGTLTFSTGVLATDDEIEAVWMD